MQIPNDRPALATRREWIRTANEAFIAGMRVTSIVASLVAVGIAVVAVVMLRHIGPGEEKEAANRREEALHDGSTLGTISAD